MNEIKRLNIIFSTALILALFLVVYLINVESKTLLIKPEHNCNKLYKGNNLSIYSLDPSVDDSTLNVAVENKNKFHFSFIPKANSYGTLPCIGISTSYMSYTIKSENKIIYSYGEEDRKIVKSGASNFKIVKIPAEYIGKRVYVNFTIKVQKLNKISSEVHIGERKNIIKEIFKLEYLELIFATFIFVMGSLMLILGITSFLLKLKAIKYTSIGLFNIFFSSYIFSQTNAIYLFIDNTILIYFLEYILASAHICTLSYILSQNLTNRKKIIGEALYVILLLNITVQTLLTITGISEFIYFREFTFGLAFVVSFALIYLTLLHKDPESPLRHASKSKKLSIYSSIILLAGMIIGTSMYNISTNTPFLYPVYVTLLFYIMIQLFVSLDTYAKDYKKSLKFNEFRDTALFDSLTKVGSRYAFDKDIKDFNATLSEMHNISIIIIDINKLKIINDHFGHHEGDDTIEQMGSILLCLEKVYEAQKAKAYRTGGDEFMFIMYNTNYSNHAYASIALENCYKKHLNDHPKSLLEFSYGSAYQKVDEDFNFEELIKTADENMYKNKKVMKENISKKQSIL